MVTNTINSTINTKTKPNDIAVNPDSILGKDDFMRLLLTELKYQDPTDPMDSEKILSQTSQLATLESADNTNKALEKLTNQLSASTNLSVISAIGKLGSLGKDTITLKKGTKPTFDLYFKHDIQSGSVTIKDKEGNIVKTFTLEPQKSGVLTFDWDGSDNNGNPLPEGEYSISSNYSDGSTGSYETKYGVFPIESVKFDKGNALLKLGEHYYPITKIAEIYQED